MGFLNLTKKGVALALSAQLVLATQAVTLAEAQMVGTDAAINKYTAMANRSVLMDELQRSEVREQIIELGVDPAEAEQRLAALSDEEISTILTQMENDSAGADIVGTLFTVFIILLVTDLLCFTRIFNFTRCIR
ncbi:PA2779 family protein [Cognatiyoonia sp. IB215182]|uniref:PA2779 family protein n=1 Tax=Cognatiyoonia sp. IB215182 TaxID=3097353 RepID=UPI002A10031F|nr:PA2779 family protein [Cognatiyoonia sp. IB215182]MDX8352581.1 PA2779 family protein [Cognatiyoonia sp. IB215182]